MVWGLSGHPYFFLLSPSLGLAASPSPDLCHGEEIQQSTEKLQALGSGTHTPQTSVSPHRTRVCTLQIQEYIDSNQLPSAPSSSDAVKYAEKGYAPHPGKAAGHLVPSLSQDPHTSFPEHPHKLKSKESLQG